MNNVQLKKIHKYNEIELCVFGRGFGECIVLSCGDDEYIVIDSFINPDTKRPIAIDYLESINAPLSSIKMVVITHWHTDHIEGISKILDSANENVKIVLSPIVQKEYFQKYINYGIQNKKSSTKEFAKVYDFIKNKNYKCVKVANNDNRLYTSSYGTNIEIYSLSPQDADLMRYINNLLEDSINQTTSLEYIDNNLLSIVLLIKFSKNGILLGADLESTNGQSNGWEAVVDNYTHNEVKSSVFKIPHHGSQNGHNDMVWTKMLAKYPFAILTVYNKNTKLPKETDIARIVKLSRSLFVIGDNSKPDKLLEKKIRKTMPSVKVKEISQKIGMVRYRKQLDGAFDENIEYFGAVKEYKNAMAYNEN